MSKNTIILNLWLCLPLGLWTSPSPASPQPLSAVSWPHHLFSPYVDAVIWPTFDFINAIDEIGIKYFNLGFVVAAAPDDCTPSWGTYYPVDAGYLQTEIGAIRDRGGDVVVSFGGAANTELGLSCGNSEDLRQAYQQVIDAYNLTRIDFDIEGTWIGDEPSVERRSQAIAALQEDAAGGGRELSVWFTLPVLPTGLLPDALNLLESALHYGVEIAGVNIMTMNYGDVPAPNPNGQMGEYAIESATSLFYQLQGLYNDAGFPRPDEELWHMIGVTPMIGLNDVTTEVFYPEDAEELLAFAQAQHIGMLSFWSLNRDGPCSGGEIPYVSPNCSSILQEPFEFSSILLPFSGGAASAPGAPGSVAECRISPNPFYGSTTIVYDVKVAGPLRLDVYDIRGRRIETLVEQFFEAGRYKEYWGAAHLA
ncbi:MAG: chitinase, partial [Candidatus Eisenbacteria bacterium]|nr:chitinase [Candidatus Eisenbacteria bacterium]